MAAFITFAAAHRRLAAAGIPAAARGGIVASAYRADYRLLAAALSGSADAICTAATGETRSAYDAAAIDAACALAAA